MRILLCVVAETLFVVFSALRPLLYTRVPRLSATVARRAAIFDVTVYLFNYPHTHMITRLHLTRTCTHTLKSDETLQIFYLALRLG